MIWKYYTPIFEYERKFLDLDRPWAGDKYFVYDLVRNLKPKKIVELGSEKGTSFFSMCQAVKDEKLKSELCAIDTWVGDKHSGLYKEDVYENFIKYINIYFPSLKIKVLRKLFDEARESFENNSIDLLHIDGLHTLAAVKHDYEGWASKVKPGGTILFHDISERDRGFGVYKFWSMLKKRGNSIEFRHSHGLGVMFKNKRIYSDVVGLESVWQRYYSTLYEYNLSKKMHYDSEEIKMRDIEIKRLEDDIKGYRKILDNITSSKFFKLWQFYCKKRDYLFKK
jgi:hypothetical protein